MTHTLTLRRRWQDHDRLRRPLLYSFSAVFALVGGYSALPLIGGATLSGADRAGRSLIAVLELAAGLIVAVLGPRLLILIPLTLALGSALVVTTNGAVPSDLSAGFCAGGLALGLALLLERSWFVISLVPLSLGYAGARYALGGARAGLNGLDECAIIASMCIAAVVFSDSLLHSSDMADRLRWASASREMELDAERIRAQHLAAARDLLHDSVLTALRAVAEPRRSAPEQTMAAVREAVERLDTAGTCDG